MVPRAHQCTFDCCGPRYAVLVRPRRGGVWGPGRSRPVQVALVVAATWRPLLYRSQELGSLGHRMRSPCSAQGRVPGGGSDVVCAATHATSKHTLLRLSLQYGGGATSGNGTDGLTVTQRSPPSTGTNLGRPGLGRPGLSRVFAWCPVGSAS